MPYTTMNLEEVSSYLHISEPDVELLVREKKIPCAHQGKRLVFRRCEVDEWANKRIMGMDEKRLRAFHKNTTARAHDLSVSSAIIAELMNVSHIDPEVRAKTNPAIMAAMVALAERTGLVFNAKELLSSVQARERQGSTAMAGGFALLHTEYHDPHLFEDSFIVLGKTIQDVPFHSPDGQTTDLFFLLCCQDNRIHLHVLARLCMMCQQTSLLLELRESRTAEEMMAVIAAKEQQIIRAL